MPADVTQLLNQIESGDPKAAEELLPLLYTELRRLASARMAKEKPDQALQATALVHEALAFRRSTTDGMITPIPGEPAKLSGTNK
jgi:hypothetical protein